MVGHRAEQSGIVGAKLALGLSGERVCGPM